VSNRLVLGTASVAWRMSLLVSPRPGALFLRRSFAANGARVAESLARHVPAGIEALTDERYGDGPDELLDLFRPSGAEALATVLWIHGGGWVGGSKEELAGWCSLLAGKGLTVVSVGYSLAPEQRYPTPVRQVLEAVEHVQANAVRLGVDPERIVLAGDSAGAQLAAQSAVIVTEPDYARAVGLEPTLAPERLRAVVLACGPFDLDRAGTTPVGRSFLKTVLWAYSGRRSYAEDPVLALASVIDHVTGRFPPAFITVGNADALGAHSVALAERLEERGVEVDTLFWPDDHEPALGHEYQFDLDGEAGRTAFDRMVAFLLEQTA